MGAILTWGEVTSHRVAFLWNWRCCSYTYGYLCIMLGGLSPDQLHFLNGIVCCLAPELFEFLMQYTHWSLLWCLFAKCCISSCISVFILSTFHCWAESSVCLCDEMLVFVNFCLGLLKPSHEITAQTNTWVYFWDSFSTLFVTISLCSPVLCFTNL